MTGRGLLGLAVSSFSFSSLCALGVICDELSPQRIDPAAWGSDHVGKPIPPFASGDECLFCHRTDVGPAWGKNRHNLTVRDADPAVLESLRKMPATRKIADEVAFVLGGEGRRRFLKPSAEGGKLDLLAGDPPRWDATTFGDRCAGCHATAVDAATRAFAARSLDCYVCHGDVPAEHTKKPELAHLSRKRDEPARVVTSICAQCHVRTGKAKSTGLPYPNTFVAGDNLFRDFRVDFSDGALRRLNPADRHVLENVREVAVLGKEGVTCLTCHDVHKQSAKKHHRVARGDICWNCHDPAKPMSERAGYEVHSATCGY